MFEHSLWQWLAGGLSALLIGLSKTGVPGLGILVAPLMAGVFPAKASTGIVLPMLIMADVFAVSYYHRHARWKHLLRIMPFSATGIVMGYLLMGRMDDRQVAVVIGVIILVLLAFTVLKELGVIRDEGIPHHLAFTVFMGLAAGITTMLANAAGPIMVIYLLAIGLPKEEFIGTGSWYFLILNCFKVPFSWHLGLITAPTLAYNALYLPLIAGGAFLGIYLLKRMPQKVFKVVSLSLSFVAALKLFWG
ncbi:MAG: sulfite exporter TauE/SafE family protein [Spirochaetes bacterium]|nr:sulfite exporter TauE/SafE family protein [Spirochaetota bacterium]